MPFLPPPYRLENISDVHAYLPPRPDEQGKAMLAFARRWGREIRKPPILGLLPSRFDVALREVRTSYHWVIREIDLAGELRDAADLIREEQKAFLAAAGGLQNDYFEVFRRILAEGQGLVRLRKACHDGEEQESAPGMISTGLQDQSDAYELLVAVLRRYLDTGRKELLFFLKTGIARLCAFTPGDHRLDEDMLVRFHNLPPSSSLILNDLHTLYVVRLDRLKKIMFQPHTRHFLLNTKHRLTKLPVPPPVKRNIIDVLNGVDNTRSIEKARMKLGQYLKLYEARLDEKEMVRVRNIVENFFSKLAAFDLFFRKLFSSDRIKDLYALFCEDLRVKEINIESLTFKAVLTMYPCKDIHDYLKGHYASD